MNISGAVLFALAIAGSSALAAPQADPPNAPPVETGPGGVVADRVDTVIINNPPRRNPGRERLAPHLLAFNRMNHDAAEHRRTQRVFVIVQDASDPAFHHVGSGGITYQLQAADSDTLDEAGMVGERCEFQPGYSLSGFVNVVRMDDRMSVDMRPVSAADALFRRLCETLGDRVGGRDRTATNFDRVSAGEGSVEIQFVPEAVGGENYEIRLARDYWLYAVAPIDPRQFVEEYAKAVESQDGRDRAQEIADEAVRTGQASVSVPASRFGLGESTARRRRDAVDSFGESFAELEREWAIHLRGVHAVMAGERRPILSQGALSSLIHRFRAGDVGTPAFWSHIGDSNDYMDGLNCAATLFLVDRQYVLASELSQYVPCRRAEIRAQRAGR